MNRFFGVLVLYKMSLEESPTFISLLQSSNNLTGEFELLVYDNFPALNSESKIFRVGNLLVNYVVDNKNSGLSRAYNYAAKIALENQKKFLIFFDQDSRFPSNYLELLINEVGIYSNEKMFVPILKENGILLSPCSFIFHKGRQLKHIEPGLLLLKNKSIFNSGLCVSLEPFIKIGGYDEKLWLDFADHQFISRYKKVYKKCVVIPVYVSHSLSSFDYNLQRQIARFKLYCCGTRTYSKLEKCFFWLLFWNFMRATKLNLHFRKLVFYKVLLQSYIIDETK